MAKTSIYLPDDLSEQVRKHGISISEVAQAALREAVKNAQIKENVMTDVQAVAERMRGIERQAAVQDRAADQRVHDLGMEWARTQAGAEALQYVAEWDNANWETFQKPLTTMSYGTAPDGTHYPGSPDGPRWEHFQAGAREVWQAVKPLLAQCGDASSLSGGRPCGLPSGHKGGHRDSPDNPQHVW